MHAVRFHAREDLRSVDEPRHGTEMTIQIIAQPSPELDGRVPDKQIHRWLNEGGAVLAQD